MAPENECPGCGRVLGSSGALTVHRRSCTALRRFETPANVPAQTHWYEGRMLPRILA